MIFLALGPLVSEILREKIESSRWSALLLAELEDDSGMVCEVPAHRLDPYLPVGILRKIPGWVYVPVDHDSSKRGQRLEKPHLKAMVSV